MAAGKLDKGLLKTGAVVSVTVENALPTVVIVSLKHGSKIFQGALIDATHRDGPLGIDITKKEIEQANEPLRSPEVLLIDPNHEPGKPPQISSLALRHTYQLDPDAVDTKLLPPPPKRDLTNPSSFRKRNVRNMRLRPRKVLCANCKQGINDNKPNPVKNVVTRSSTKQASEKANNGDKADEPTTAPTEPKPSPEPDSLPSRKGKKIEKSDDNKKVPVLKLSLPKPSFKVGAVNIPKAESVRGQENNDPEVANPTLNHEEYRRRKKALKKAKYKEKLEKDNALTQPIAENGHHKRKHGKKMKRKHKHKDLEQENPNNEQPPDNLRIKLPPLSQQKSDEYDFDSPEKVEISNAQEFTNLKNRNCVVRLEKIDIDQSKSQNDNPQTSEADNPNFVPQDIELPDSNIQSLNPHVSTDKQENTAQASSSTTPYHVEVSDISDAEDNAPNSPTGSVNSSHSVVPGAGVVAGAVAGVVAAPGLPAYPPYNPSLLAPHFMPRTVTQVVAEVNLGDGRMLNTGDIVWGRFHGVPSWPARIHTITEYLKDGAVASMVAEISWYGYHGTVDVNCNELYPFLDFYKVRHTKSKDGFYQVNVKEATKDAKSIADNQGKYVDSSLFDSDSDGLEECDSLHDMDDAHSYQDKENLDSVDSHNMLDYDDLKPIQNDNVTTTTPTQTPTHIGKADSFDDIEQFNNYDNFS